MIRDLLFELHQKSISVEAAEMIFDEIIEGPKASVAPSLLGLSSVEWTAFCQGVPFDLLSNWRYYGWPNLCSTCGKAISMEKFGWKVRESAHKTFSINHIECPIN